MGLAEWPTLGCIAITQCQEDTRVKLVPPPVPARNLARSRCTPVHGMAGAIDHRMAPMAPTTTIAWVAHVVRRRAAHWRRRTLAGGTNMHLRSRCFGHPFQVKLPRRTKLWERSAEGRSGGLEARAGRGGAKMSAALGITGSDLDGASSARLCGRSHISVRPTPGPASSEPSRVASSANNIKLRFVRRTACQWRRCLS